MNTFIGYALYGKIVFKAQGLKHHRPLLRYFLLMILMWVMNASGIEIAEAMGINKNLGAAALVPCLAMISFIAQKYWVFK